MRDFPKLTYENFGRPRQRCLFDAARSELSAKEILDSHAPDTDTSRRLRRRAAEFLKHAALFYRQAGLGLCAKAALTRAADVLAELGLDAESERCRKRAAAIPEYWKDEET